MTGGTAPRGGFLARLPEDGAAALLALGEDVALTAGTRLFEEGRPADRFWVLHQGTVTLSTRVPGRPEAVVETVGAGELVGWSWLVPPHLWRLAATAASAVQAAEFPAAEVRDLCTREPELGRVLTLRVAEVVGRRLEATRARLLDLYAPPSGAAHPGRLP
ncbi:Crp/Fnr family transcriptional regulator [Streptomyces sp. NPDC090029]|uniref:Crp/Fnr family transcriptional regulator n=1 Tax=Streptomyces sp. NPDC090029 TaxID=3365924 RepID=UPI0038197C45